MDNFHLQVTPLQITYQSKQIVPLSCLLKKVATSTGHLLEKHEIKSRQVIAGKAKFQEGPIFSMSKEFQLKNTKISLHFLAKKERNISCIGSTELDLANLPNQPHSIMELQLDNCIDPKGKLKIEIIRRQQRSKSMRKEKVKPQKMNILNTQSQIKQQMETSRRNNPNIPTAYEISRRNYKQVEISCHEDKKVEKKSTSSKKGSYLQRNILHHNNQFNNTSKVSNSRKEQKLIQQSPIPRRVTPQPIPPNSNLLTNPTVALKPRQGGKYSISSKSKLVNNCFQTREISGKANGEQQTQQPQKLKVTPYQKRALQDVENKNEGFKSLQQQKNNKYKVITQTLQLIHDKITNSKDKSGFHTQQNTLQKKSQFRAGHQYNRSCCEQSLESEDKWHKQQVKSQCAGVKCFNPNISNCANGQVEFKQANNKKDINPCEDTQQSIQKKFQDIKSVKNKSPQTSPQSQKATSITIKQAPQISTDNKIKAKNLNQKQCSTSSLDGQIQLYEIEIYKKQIQNYKRDLISALKNLAQKDKYIQRIEDEVEDFKISLKQKQSLIEKLNREYQLKFYENMTLQEKLSSLEKVKSSFKRQQSLTGNLKLSQLSRQSVSQGKEKEQIKDLNQQMVLIRKRLLDIQTQLKYKQNQNKMLLIKIANLQHEKKNLEQEISDTIRKDKNEITRKASLARIQQITSTSLVQNTKRQNDSLKNEVKILMEKLQSLNCLFEQLIKGGKDKQLVKSVVFTSNESQNKLKILQQRCKLVEEELKKKKNELAQIINLIWKHQDGDLMNEVFALITQSQQ